MFFASIIHDYFVWHYTRAWWQMWGVWRNFLWMVIHFFSLPQLSRSLFSPFKRITEGRGDTFSFEDLATYVIVNLISRIIGAIVRIVIILIGLITLAFTIVGGFVTYLFWMVTPFMVIVLFGAGISLLLI